MPGLPLRCVVGRGHKYVILAHKHTSLGVLSTIFGFPAEFRSRKRETGMIQPTPLAKTQKKRKIVRVLPPQTWQQLKIRKKSPKS